MSIVYKHVHHFFFKGHNFSFLLNIHYYTLTNLFFPTPFEHSPSVHCTGVICLYAAAAFQFLNPWKYQSRIENVFVSSIPYCRQMDFKKNCSASLSPLRYMYIYIMHIFLMIINVTIGQQSSKP